MSRIAFCFPGQGSQKPGMGRELAEAFPVAREVFEEVDEALNQRLSRIIFTGSAEELTRTENTQPALMAVSMAVLRVLEQHGVTVADHVHLLAGHSLGEYTALTAAGSLTLADAARVLRLRGQAMQQASPEGTGGMAAILGLEIAEVQAVLDQITGSDIISISNDNAPGQVVISGHARAIEACLPLFREAGAKRALPLNVSAAFHCALMAPAAEHMAEVLAQTSIQPPQQPIVTNTEARAEEDPAVLRAALVKQVTACVRWRESVLYMQNAGITQIAELGAGHVLTGLNKRIAPDLQAISATTPAEIETLAKGF